MLSMSAETYDFAIIGAGSVGLIAADFAVKLGARVALLERERIGGDCTWSGCVPSKSLLKVAKVAHDLRTAAYCVPAAAFKMLPDQTNPLVMLPVAPVAPCAPIAPCEHTAGERYSIAASIRRIDLVQHHINHHACNGYIKPERPCDSCQLFVFVKFFLERSL